MAKANYATDKAAAYNETLAPDGPLVKQFAYLEKLHPGDGPYFNNQTTKRVAGVRRVRVRASVHVRMCVRFCVFVCFSSCGCIRLCSITFVQCLRRFIDLTNPTCLICGLSNTCRPGVRHCIDARHRHQPGAHHPGCLPQVEAVLHHDDRLASVRWHPRL